MGNENFEAINFLEVTFFIYKKSYIVYEERLAKTISSHFIYRIINWLPNYHVIFFYLCRLLQILHIMVIVIFLRQITKKTKHLWIPLEIVN